MSRPPRFIEPRPEAIERALRAHWPTFDNMSPAEKVKWRISMQAALRAASETTTAMPNHFRPYSAAPKCEASGQDFAGTSEPDATGRVPCPACGRSVMLRYYHAGKPRVIVSHARAPAE